MKYSCNACGRYVEGSCDCYSPIASPMREKVDYLKAQEIANQFGWDYNLVCRILRAYLED